MTNAELAILSLVAEHPRHGYEIERTIEEREMRDWTEIGFSSIYYLLKKLENIGLVESHLHQPKGRGPARKVYQITPAGRKAQMAATLETLSEPQQRHTSFLLGLSNLSAVPPEQALSALRAYRDSLIERGEYVAARTNVQSPLPDFVESMFDYSLTLIQAELTWVEEFIQELSARETARL